MALALTFLEQYHKDGDELLNHNIRAAKAVDAHTFTGQAESLKQTLSPCPKANGHCFLGLEGSADGE
jgi:hypothetical protein